jgi:DnaK suppressor protein
MQIFDAHLTQRFHKILVQREAELRAIVGASAEYADADAHAGSHEVVDFKDMASEQTLAVVDDAKVDHSARELELVPAARRRLLDGSYGICLDCGDPIDLRRLTALPATPFCTACQSVHEHGASLALRA